tara:strand:- start:2515 stop:2748 length:234 start_codon:yes stop_codon:yes gene_type:complete
MPRLFLIVAATALINVVFSLRFFNKYPGRKIITETVENCRNTTSMSWEECGNDFWEMYDEDPLFLKWLKDFEEENIF